MNESPHELYRQSVWHLEESIRIDPNPSGEAKSKILELAGKLAVCGYPDVEARARKIQRKLKGGAGCMVLSLFLFTGILGIVILFTLL